MKKGVFLLLLSAALLSGCGDDADAIVPTVNPVYPLDAEPAGNREYPADGGISEGCGETAAASGQIADAGNMTDVSGDKDSENLSDTEAGEVSESGADADEISITISAAGDVTLGNYVGQDYAWSFREMWTQQSPSYFLENVSDIFVSDDMTIVNLEGPLTDAEKRREEQTYCIFGDPEFADILTEGSVEAVSMANNHRLDYYEQGTADTVAALEERGIVYAYDRNFGMYETKGIRIGFISVNEVGQGAAVEKILEEGIASLREQGADLVVANCHWGIERENIPEEYQQSLGRKCIDMGADLVLGHHPHVLQGIEAYKGKYIVYSLGNFCFGANRNPADKDCIIFQQTFVFREGVLEEGSEARIIPCLISSVKSRNDYRPTPAKEEDAERILGRMNEYSAAFGVQTDGEGNLRQQ